MAKKPRLGLVGVGMMGHGLAANLLRKGFPLAFLAHPGNRPTDDLIALGATASDAADALAAASDALLLCLPGSPEVDAAMDGTHGVLAGLRNGTIVIDFSTSAPDATLRVAQAVTARGGRFADAPMTRTPKEAEEGRLNLMVGADDATLAEIRPILEAVAENIYHAGPISAGHRLKLLHNFLALGNSALLAEALVCAAKGQVNLETLCEVIASGGADSAVFRRIRPYIEKGDDSAFRFSLANAYKDMGYYLNMAGGGTVAAPGAAAVHQIYALAMNLGKGQGFVPQLIDLLGAAHGVKPRH
jgi:3-hydroxyisobutyrate dehydrogenase